jgi:hypothetical protein
VHFTSTANIFLEVCFVMENVSPTVKLNANSIFISPQGLICNKKIFDVNSAHIFADLLIITHGCFL